MWADMQRRYTLDNEQTPDHVKMNSVSRFTRFVMDQPCEDGAQVYLADLAKDWLEQGDAVETTGGNYTTYLRTCLFVADLAMKDEHALKFAPFNPDEEDDKYRQLVGIINPQNPHSALAFDQEYYEAWAFHRLTGGTGTPPNQDPPG
jgi:hypothetical protein